MPGRVSRTRVITVGVGSSTNPRYSTLFSTRSGRTRCRWINSMGNNFRASGSSLVATAAALETGMLRDACCSRRASTRLVASANPGRVLNVVEKNCLSNKRMAASLPAMMLALRGSSSRRPSSPTVSNGRIRPTSISSLRLAWRTLTMTSPSMTSAKLSDGVPCCIMTSPGLYCCQVERVTISCNSCGFRFAKRLLLFSCATRVSRATLSMGIFFMGRIFLNY